MDILFWSAAMVGTLLFAIKTLLSFSGGDHVDVDADGFHHGTDDAFKIFSTQSLTGFFMMFGWVGLACYKQYELSSGFSILWAFLAGALMMIVNAFLFKMALSLVSHGTKFHVEELLGRSASVYQKIPAEGVGKIQVTVNGHQREVFAVSATQSEISSFTEVVVKKVKDNQTVVVEAIKFLGGS